MEHMRIVIRAKTRDALEVLARKANVSLKDRTNVVYYSDVIDTLLEIASEQLLEDEVLETIVIMAERD